MTKSVVITGGTSGIGEVAAIRLAEQGMRIVLVARDAKRGAATLAQLQTANPRADHVVHLADLSVIADMKRVAQQIAATEPLIDVLINNAGAVFMGRQRTPEGLAPSFALNHLSYYVLTLLLMPRLAATPGARIVCTSSRAHRFGRLDFSNLQIDGILGYAASKLANLLFVRRLAQRLDNQVTINACHPGFVATRFADNTGLLWRSLMKLRKRLHGRTPAEGARALLYLAESPEMTSLSGLYCVDETPVLPYGNAQSDADAQQLWTVSARLTGIDWRTP